MGLNTQAAYQSSIRQTDAVNRSVRPPPMVKFFALAGVIITAVFISTLVQWIMSPDFKPAPVGSDPIPAFTLFLVRSIEVFFILGGIGFLWFVLIKPWRRDGKISWDGTLMLAMFTMWVQDPICNYFNFTFTYNAYFYNMGSWTMYLPGWQAPRQGNLPEPFFLMGGVYLWVTVVNVLVFCWLMKKLRVWLPNMSVLGHLPFAFVALMLVDMATDVPGPWLGIYHYAAAPRFGTLWAGTPHQLPLYTVIVMSLHYLNLGLLRLYRNDRGESWAERGLGEMKISARARSLLRFFALVGYCNLSYFIIYFMPYNWFALQSDTMPKYPSYMRVEICGQGTPYACPSREVPMPSRNSLAISPDDSRLSAEARQN